METISFNEPAKLFHTAFKRMTQQSNAKGSGNYQPLDRMYNVSHVAGRGTEVALQTSQQI
jgi:hypothetical protein